MANEKQVWGTIAVLGAAAVAVVAVLLGVLDEEWPQTPATSQNASPSLSAESPGTQPSASPPATAPAPTPVDPSAAPAGKAAASPAEAPIAPSFDVVRVEPDGESVIAGRAAPGATIELLRGEHVHARAVADASGLFALVPPPLPNGTHQVVLQSIAPDGTRQRSRESVTIVVNADGSRPLVALTAPDKPTVLLSNPEPPEAKVAQGPAAAPDPAPEAPSPQTPEQPKPQDQASTAPEAAAPPPAPEAPAQPQPRPEIKIVSVEAEEGRLFVSGQAAPGATVRLYLNESLVAPGGAGGDGKVSFAIGSGVRPGDYRVRLDDVDPVSGQVKSRAEVSFKVPAQVASAEPAPPPAAPQAGQAPAPQEAAAAAPPSTATGNRTASALPDAALMAAGTIVIPNIETAIVSRGDNLWRISQRIYGKGYRYTEIYGANQEQIRDPDLIYPGQVFVIPNDTAPQTD